MRGWVEIPPRQTGKVVWTRFPSRHWLTSQPQPRGSTSYWDANVCKDAAVYKAHLGLPQSRHPLPARSWRRSEGRLPCQWEGVGSQGPEQLTYILEGRCLFCSPHTVCFLCVSLCCILSHVDLHVSSQPSSCKAEVLRLYAFPILC